MSCCIDFLPDPCHDGEVLTNVAAIAFDGVTPFELGLLCESFGMDRSDDGVPLLDFAVCGPHVGTFRTTCGFGVTVEHDLTRVAEADLVAVPAGNPAPEHLGPVVEAVRAAYERGARILSVCSGAFILGEAGLLDGRECTTHWKHTDELAQRFPQARVVPEVLYVDADPIITSAGTAAGLDAALHLWRKEYGAAAAAKVARRMVVPPQREGGQAQYISSPVVDCEAETLGPLLTWIVALPNIADLATVLHELTPKRRVEVAAALELYTNNAFTGGSSYSVPSSRTAVTPASVFTSSSPSYTDRCCVVPLVPNTSGPAPASSMSEVGTSRSIEVCVRRTIQSASATTPSRCSRG